MTLGPLFLSFICQIQIGIYCLTHIRGNLTLTWSCGLSFQKSHFYLCGRYSKATSNDIFSVGEPPQSWETEDMKTRAQRWSMCSWISWGVSPWCQQETDSILRAHWSHTLLPSVALSAGRDTNPVLEVTTSPLFSWTKPLEKVLNSFPHTIIFLLPSKV